MQPDGTSSRSVCGADVAPRVPLASALWRSSPLLILPTLLAVAVAFGGIYLEPDASYYVGGLSLFPSPLGTLLGTAGGYAGLAMLNIGSTFAIVLLVGLIAIEVGNRPLIAQGLALLVAPSGWFISWGMDAPAVAVLLAGALLHLRGRSVWAVVMIAIAAATHPATLPLALGALMTRPARRPVTLLVAVGLLAGGACIAYLTWYRTGFGVLKQPGAVVEGAAEVFHACWPLLPLVPVMTLLPRMRMLVFGSLVGAVLAGAIPASVGQTGLTRYAVPCVFLAVASLGFRHSVRLPSLRRSVTGGRRSGYPLPVAGAWRDS